MYIDDRIVSWPFIHFVRLFVACCLLVCCSFVYCLLFVCCLCVKTSSTDDSWKACLAVAV